MKIVMQEWGLLVIGFMAGSFFVRFAWEITEKTGIFSLFIGKYLAQIMG